MFMLFAGAALGILGSYIAWHIITRGGDLDWPRLSVRLRYDQERRRRSSPKPPVRTVSQQDAKVVDLKRRTGAGR